MSLIAMCCHDTEENGRTELTYRTLECLFDTVDFDNHRLFIIDNGSCFATRNLLSRVAFNEGTVIRLEENIGTAAAINLAWKHREPGEHCVKMDNDVVIHYDNWIEEMEEAINRHPVIGQCGLKRKDCWEHPAHENPEWRSKMLMLPHEPGQTWIQVEQVKHVMGTCVMHNSALIDKVGGLWQPTRYGHDDVIMSWRSNLSGFINVFLSNINIDHIDPGGTEYQKWKEAEGSKNGHLVSSIVDEYISGKRSLFYEL